MEENLALIQWPLQSGTYKVVQFLRERERDEQAYLRFGREPGVSNDFHDFIQRRFAAEVGIQFLEVRNPRGSIIVKCTNNGTF